MKLAVLGAALVIVASAVSASAQSVRPERPYRGIFGGGYGNTEQLLTLDASLDGGYDTDVLAGGNASSGTVSTNGNQEAGAFGQFGASLEYTLNRNRVGFGATASTTQRTYPSLGLLGSYGGGFNGWFQIARRTRLTVSESSTYQPFLNYGFFAVPYVPGDVGIAPDVTPNFQSGVAPTTQIRNSLSTSLTQSLTPRASVSFSGSVDKTNASGVVVPDLNAKSVGGRFSYQVAKGFGFHAGYGYREGMYSNQAVPVTQTPVFHNFDVGIDYNRPLSFSRRATLSFGTGSAAYQDLGVTRYYVTGNANFTYELNRTWNVTSAYSRDAQLIESLRAPVFGDSLTVGLHGLLNRRVDVGASVSGSRGTVGTVATSDYESYYGNATLVFGVSRRIAITTTYSYFHQVFGRAVDLTPATPQNLNRQTIQAGLTFRLPLISRARRPNAAG
jgi:hypothetical protein